MITQMQRGAELSDCRKYRYSLWRIWDTDKPYVAFIGLNPSTADENTDDNTIRKCMGFAARWGYGGIYMVNLFAFRATKPPVMLAESEPIGEQNDRHLLNIASTVGKVVAAWGKDGVHLGRDKVVLKKLNNRGIHVYAFGTNLNGTPKHPLYQPNGAELVMFRRSDYRI